MVILIGKLICPWPHLQVAIPGQVVGQGGVPCPHTEHTEYGIRWQIGLEKSILDEFVPRHPKELKNSGREGHVNC